MRQIVLSGLGDHVARKITTQGLEPQEKKRLRYAYQVCTLESPQNMPRSLPHYLLSPSFPLFLSSITIFLSLISSLVPADPSFFLPPCHLIPSRSLPQSMLCTEPVYMHSSTVLLHETPDFVVFQEITETSKLYMRGVSTIEASWLPRIQPDYCTFSAPLEDPPPFFDATAGSVVCHMACTYGEGNGGYIHVAPFPPLPFLTAIFLFPLPIPLLHFLSASLLQVTVAGL